MNYFLPFFVQSRPLERLDDLGQCKFVMMPDGSCRARKNRVAVLHRAAVKLGHQQRAQCTAILLRFRYQPCRCCDMHDVFQARAVVSQPVNYLYGVARTDSEPGEQKNQKAAATTDSWHPPYGRERVFLGSPLGTESARPPAPLRCLAAFRRRGFAPCSGPGPGSARAGTAAYFCTAKKGIHS